MLFLSLKPNTTQRAIFLFEVRYDFNTSEHLEVLTAPAYVCCCFEASCSFTMSGKDHITKAELVHCTVLVKPKNFKGILWFFDGKL